MSNERLTAELAPFRVKSSRSKVSSSVGVAILRLTGALVSIGYVKVYTRLLNNEALGVFFILSTASYFLNALVFVPVDYFQQSKIYSYREKGLSLKSFIIFNKRMLCWIGLVTAILVICFLPFRHIVSEDLAICVALAVVTYVTASLKNVLNNLEHQVLVAVLYVLEASVKIGCLVLVWRIYGLTAQSALASNAIALAAMAPFLWILAHRRNIFDQGEVVAVHWRDIVNFGSPISVGAVAAWGQLQGYRLVLGALHFTKFVGIYGAVANIGVASMNAVSMVYGQLYSPNLYKSHGAYMGTYVRNAVILVGSLAVIMFAASNVIVPLVTRANLGHYAPLAVFGVLTEGGTTIIGGFAIYLAIKNRTNGIMFGPIIGLASLAPTFIALRFLRILNVYGIGVALTLSQFCVITFLWFNWRRLRRA